MRHALCLVAVLALFAGQAAWAEPPSGEAKKKAATKAVAKAGQAAGQETAPKKMDSKLSIVMVYGEGSKKKWDAVCKQLEVNSRKMRQASVLYLTDAGGQGAEFCLEAKVECLGQSGSRYYLTKVSGYPPDKRLCFASAAELVEWLVKEAQTKCFYVTGIYNNETGW